MLLTSPGDNRSSPSSDSIQEQSDTAEEPLSVEGDRAQSDHACESPSTSVRTDFDASESRLSVDNTGGAIAFAHRSASRLQKVPPPEIAPDGLYALRQVAETNAPRQARTSWLSRGNLAKLIASNAVESAEVSSFAAPLSPLRARDIQALSELFLRDDIYAIEADVSQRLLALLPEPCWEDEVFTFLGDFL